jgi:hypothetical protein
MPRCISARRFTILPLLATTLVACGGPPAAPIAEVQPTSTTVPTTIPPTATTTPTLVPTAMPTPTPTIVPTPTAIVSAVTGEQLFARGTVRQRPWMVMIDNHPDAYPQSGMDKAAIVFEGLAEYGITRFVALYDGGATAQVGEIGPVRSTRLYFAQWAMGYHPIYAHAGGSPDGVQLAETTDQFINFEALREGAYTWRDGNRAAPHNLYTNADRLRAFAVDKGVVDLNDPDQGYLYDAIAPGSSVEAGSIDYYFEDRSSRAGFRYDAATNGYYRTMRDQPHVDRVTGKQLWTSNVVVMEVAESARVGDDKRRIDQQVVGSGPARVFLAGRAINATWRKDTEAGPLRFYTAEQQELVFNAGPIWVAAIPAMDRLSVQ